MDERRHNAPRRRKEKIPFCLSGCLPHKTHAKLSSIVAAADSPGPPLCRRSTASPPPWLQSRPCSSKSSDPESPNPRGGGKCVNLVCRIGNCCGRHQHQLRRSHGYNCQATWQKRHSTDVFHYDASSYALNFEERDGDEALDEYPLRSFISRLPASPPRNAPENALATCSC